MKFNIKKPLACMLAMGLSVPTMVQATNGYFLIGYGAKSRAMGGTGIADNRNGMAAAFNPATMIDSGTEFDIGAELFVPPRAIHHESGVLGYTDERSSRDIFLIPSMGGTWKWKEDTTLGFAFIGGGLKTLYNQSANSDTCKSVNSGGVAGYTACPPTVFNVLNSQADLEAGVELIQMQFVPSIAFKMTEKQTIGFSVVMAAQFFRAKGLQDFQTLGFTSGAQGGLTSGSWDQSFGMGYRIGWLGKFNDDKLRLGINYSSRVWMSRFDNYNNLFAEQGDFDIPENIGFGLSYDFTPSVTVAFDIQRILFGSVRSVGNPGPDASNPSSFFSQCQGLPNADPCKLGGRLGLGMGWQNQTVYKFGVNWAYNQKWDFRIGWNHGASPVQEDQVLFNMLTPATPEDHFTIGAGYALAEDWQLDMNFMYALNNTIKGPTAFGKGGAIVTGSNASIAMRQYSLGATLGIKF